MTYKDFIPYRNISFTIDDHDTETYRSARNRVVDYVNHMQEEQGLAFKEWHYGEVELWAGVYEYCYTLDANIMSVFYVRFFGNERVYRIEPGQAMLTDAYEVYAADLEHARDKWDTAYGIHFFTDEEVRPDRTRFADRPCLCL